MRDLDEIDRHILRLLLEDARRPYSDIAGRVDLSAPAVSDRIDRLRELGVIRSFTLDLDRSLLSEGVPVLVELAVGPADAASVAESLRSLDEVEHVFRTADAAVVFKATVRDGDVPSLLSDAVDLGAVRDVEVRLLADAQWTPTLGDATLALTCVECGNTVTSEGVAARIGDDRYHFCCDSCRSNFESRYEELKRGA
jgi:DNA-binding Lrp family transcriptional regulator